ncbi:TetR family transcriptional regulator [Nocardia puris]|uniref:TetR/AcrR family transcriptional regulator n=1 Tax=Nocardia puris TaxID=208602 RepID=UPI001894578C|nr:TetR family transcriptional regulator [Nocardia puris]MBF6210350.1 TetR family transcriptional regulator [Nocardia puris]MBF6367425.1 TetR family transcriptional regulator [Nocardia puris]MBF6457610.1 TetR family transcriptional regulator [Nocardia puris]
MTKAADADLTTAARIRDTAIEVFGARGFQVGVRAIAAAAGVSPGLVNHHFGSKEGLRTACDNRVLELVRSQKLRTLTSSDTAKGILAAMAEIDAYGPLLAYLVRSLQAGGPVAESLFERMVDDAYDYIERGVEAGVIKPSRDPMARARLIVTLNTGAVMLWVQLHHADGEEVDFAQVMRAVAEEFTPPVLEIYTQGLLADPSLLDILTKEK